MVIDRGHFNTWRNERVAGKHTCGLQNFVDNIVNCQAVHCKMLLKFGPIDWIRSMNFERLIANER